MSPFVLVDLVFALFCLKRASPRLIEVHMLVWKSRRKLRKVAKYMAVTTSRKTCRMREHLNKQPPLTSTANSVHQLLGTDGLHPFPVSYTHLTLPTILLV